MAHQQDLLYGLLWLGQWDEVLNVISAVTLTLEVSETDPLQLSCLPQSQQNS